jgi:hypothetical protein
MGLTNWKGLVCESRAATKCTLASLTPPATSRRSFMIPVWCFRLCILYYRQPPQCDKLPFTKFTTFCPLNPVLDATKINPLKCKTCNAIRNAYCREHFGQFVTAVHGANSRLYFATFPPIEGQETTSYWLVLWQLFPPLYFLCFISWLWNSIPRGNGPCRSRREYEIFV